MLSHTKEKIIDILNKELDVLSKEYDKKINYLQEENRRLKNELVAAKRHHNPNAALQQQITELQSKYNMLSSFVSENVDIKFILCFFDQLSKYSSSEGLFAESLFLRLCFEENKLNLISPIIKHLGSEKSVLQQLQRNSLHLLIDTLNDIFEEELPQIEEVDDIYLSILQLILRLWDTEAERTLSHWLVDNYEVIQHRIIDTNAPGLMLVCLKCYFLYNLKEQFSYMINYILEKEWEFIDGNIEKNDYIKFLWYSWYVNQEEQLLHASTESAKYLIETDIEMEFYWILHLFLGFEASYEKIKEQIEVFEKQASLFDKAERNILLSIIMRKIESFRKEFLEEAILNQKNVSFRKMVQVICLSKNKKIMDELQEETIELALFENNLSNMIKKYIQIKGFSAKGQGPVYVTVEQLREINQTAKPFWVRSIPYSEQRINQGMEVAATTNFVWPSTEIKGKGNQEVESNGLNNESELKRLGYQITGMTRVKRWIILEKAVQELGLKKVAYTIAHHVKLRKGQKDGQRKFSYSITEWEYDLHKLKQTYYKNDFVWPKTNN